MLEYGMDVEVGVPTENRAVQRSREKERESKSLESGRLSDRQTWRVQNL